MQRGENTWDLSGGDQRTEDGFFINREAELDTLDHSCIVEGEFTDSQADTKSKKVSFAAADERYEIERPGQVKTLGNKLFTFSPPKPMRKLPGKESSEEELEHTEHPLTGPVEIPILRKSSSKEPSPLRSDSSAKALLSSFKRLGSRSPDPAGREGSGSLFGSLLRKGRKGSRSASRQSSVERGSQDLGSEDEVKEDNTSNQCNKKFHGLLFNFN